MYTGFNVSRSTDNVRATRELLSAVSCVKLIFSPSSRHLLESIFIVAVGQAAWLSQADKSKIFFKCLNRWLPRSLEVKIKNVCGALELRMSSILHLSTPPGFQPEGWWFWEHMQHIILPLVWQHAVREDLDANHYSKGIKRIFWGFTKTVKEIQQ